MQQNTLIGVFIITTYVITLELTAKILYDELVERCKQGDSSGFKQLYHQYVNAMYNTSFRIVNNAADAEDIVQEAFVDAFRNIEVFNYQSTFGAWMKRIVINKSLNHLRDRKMKLIDINQSVISEKEDEEEVNEDEIEFKVSEIKKAVALLPDGYRTVFTLCAFEQYNYDQVAQALHITESTARTQYHRAKKQLLHLIKGGIR